MRIKLLLFSMVIYFLIANNPVGACGCSDLFLPDFESLFPIIILIIIAMVVIRYLKKPDLIISDLKWLLKKIRGLKKND